MILNYNIFRLTNYVCLEVLQKYNFSHKIQLKYIILQWNKIVTLYYRKKK